MKWIERYRILRHYKTNVLQLPIYNLTLFSLQLRIYFVNATEECLPTTHERSIYNAANL